MKIYVARPPTPRALPPYHISLCCCAAFLLYLQNRIANIVQSSTRAKSVFSLCLALSFLISRL